jgi:periplasmic protein CpxP/Spy
MTLGKGEEKQMRRTWGVKLCMAVAAAFLATTGFAQGNPDPNAAGPGPGPGFGMHRPPMERAMGRMGEHARWWNDPTEAAKLKLTDAQRKAMDDTLQQHRESLVDLRSTVEKEELELGPMMKEDQPNEGNILAQIDKIAQARAELEKANARFLLAIRSKLTPEQWKQLQADRASRPHPAPGMRPRWRDGAPAAAPAEGQGAPPPPPGGPQSMLDDDAALSPPPPPPAPAFE